MTARETVARIRDIISECTDNELALMDELLAEAEGWKMRQRELEEEGVNAANEMLDTRRERRAQNRERGAEALAVAVAGAALAAVCAGALTVACVRGCRPAHGPAHGGAGVREGRGVNAAHRTAALYKENWRRGIYGDEMCEFVNEERAE